MAKIHIGIDPGVKTGFAQAINGKLVRLETTDFWEVYEGVKAMWSINDVAIHIEDTNDLPVFHHGANRKAQGAIGRNVGEVCREASLLIQGFERLGYNVIPHRGKRSKKVDHKTFCRITGWKGRTNQHQRDAACLII
jgi:hypothetical protein